jgi:single-stranded DNA-binding protein
MGCWQNSKPNRNFNPKARNAFIGLPWPICRGNLFLYALAWLPWGGFDSRWRVKGFRKDPIIFHKGGMSTMTTNSKSNRPFNFVVFTLGIIRDGGELSDTLTGTGKAFATARGYNYTGKRKEEQTKPSMFFDVKAFSFDDTVSKLVQQVADLSKGAKVTVKGRLGYRKWVSQNSVEREKLEVIASSIEAFDPKDANTKPSSFVMLTLKAIKDGGVVDFTQNGRARGKVSAMLSTGKDASGNYREPLWLDVVNVAQDDQITPTIDALGQLQKGDYFTVKGSLSMEEWTDKDGNQRRSYSVWANSIEPFSWGDADEQGALEDEPELEGEPA